MADGISKESAISIAKKNGIQNISDINLIYYPKDISSPQEQKGISHEDVYWEVFWGDKATLIDFRTGKIGETYK